MSAIKHKIFAILFSILLIVCLALGVNNIATNSRSKTINLVYALDEITSDVTFTQTIIPEQDGLNAISLNMATYGRDNTSHLLCELTDEAGNRIHYWDVLCSTIIDNKEITLELGKPIADSQGKTYYLNITSDAVAGNGVTIYCNNGEGVSGLSINGVPDNLTLCHHLIYKSSLGAGIKSLFGTSPLLVLILVLVLIASPVLSVILSNRYGTKAAAFMLMPVIIFSLCIHRIYEHAVYSNNAPSPYAFILALLIFVIIWIALSILVFELVYKRSCPIEKIAVIAVSLFSLVSLIVLTPGSTPDEPAHYLISYNYSDYMLAVPLRVDNYETPDANHLYMRDCDRDFFVNCKDLTVKPVNYSNVSNRFDFVSRETTLNLTDTESLGSGSIDRNPPAPLGYMLSALGISVGRILHLGGAPTYYLGRIFNIAAFVIMLYWAIKIIPVGKELLLVISLFPMVQQTTASYSYDSFILGIAFIFTALLISILYSPDKVSLKQLIVLSVLCFIIAPSKLVYFPLVGGVLAIQNSKIPFKKPVLVKLAVVFAGVLGLLVFQAQNIHTYLTLRTVMADSVSSSNIVSVIQMAPVAVRHSVSEFIADPLAFIELLLMTLYINAPWYLSTLVGGSLGWFQISTPISIYIVYLVFMLAAVIKNENEVPFINKLSRVWFRVLVLGSALLVILSMAIAYEHPTFEYIDGIQGRYFLPALPLLLLTFRTKNVSLNANFSKKLIFGICYYGFIFWTHCLLIVLGAL